MVPLTRRSTGRRYVAATSVTIGAARRLPVVVRHHDHCPIPIAYCYRCGADLAVVMAWLRPSYRFRRPLCLLWTQRLHLDRARLLHRVCTVNVHPILPPASAGNSVEQIRVTSQRLPTASETRSLVEAGLCSCKPELASKIRAFLIATESAMAEFAGGDHNPMAESNRRCGVGSPSARPSIPERQREGIAKANGVYKGWGKP